MLQRMTAICVVLCLLLPTLCVSASAHSILWVSTSDHTDLVKDEEYEAAPVLMMAVPGVEVASPLVEGTDGGLVILYEELGPPELTGVEEEPVQPEPASVEEEPAPEPISGEDEAELPPEAELEEIELEENTNGEIQIP